MGGWGGPNQLLPLCVLFKCSVCFMSLKDRMATLLLYKPSAEALRHDAVAKALRARDRDGMDEWRPYGSDNACVLSVTMAQVLEYLDSAPRPTVFFIEYDGVHNSGYLVVLRATEP